MQLLHRPSEPWPPPSSCAPQAWDLCAMSACTTYHMHHCGKPVIPKECHAGQTVDHPLRDTRLMPCGRLCDEFCEVKVLRQRLTVQQPCSAEMGSSPQHPDVDNLARCVEHNHVHGLDDRLLSFKHEGALGTQLLVPDLGTPVREANIVLCTHRRVDQLAFHVVRCLFDAETKQDMHACRQLF
eukprot:354762-Chlamydomonas_euryale.AAC.13